ncbi:hypothetical protein [Crenothrix sp.]|uniref:hypothetical protein n=1 Tax=Crenothrix sp. TaxID=3100433 RepID=UPI00374D40BF
MIASGFCLTKFRYIPDDEKIQIAINYLLKENRETVANDKDRAVVYPFQDANALLASNPSICNVSGSLKGDMDWLDKIQGHLASYVTLEFMAVYNGEPKKVRRTVAITNCGEAWVS